MPFQFEHLQLEAPWHRGPERNCRFGLSIRRRYPVDSRGFRICLREHFRRSRFHDVWQFLAQ